MDDVVRARVEAVFTTDETRIRGSHGDSERESTPSETQADFWRNVKPTPGRGMASNRVSRPAGSWTGAPWHFRPYAPSDAVPSIGRDQTAGAISDRCSRGLRP